MNEPAALPQPQAPAFATPDRAPAEAQVDAAVTAYVGLLAGCFEIGRLAAGRRLNRAGLREPLLNA